MKEVQVCTLPHRPSPDSLPDEVVSVSPVAQLDHAAFRVAEEHLPSPIPLEREDPLGFGGEIATWVGALETPVTSVLFPLWRFGARRRLAATA